MLTLTLWAPVAVAQNPPVYESNGKLFYNVYANQGDTITTNVLPDFSFAGYRGGGETLPKVKTVIRVAPRGGDCRALIQDAIDRVSTASPDNNGFRGAVLLKKGIYLINGSLRIGASGVVLRGEGNGTNGTVLIATEKSKHDLIYVTGTGGGNSYGELPMSRKKILDQYVPTGATSFQIESPHSFSPGDVVVVQKIPNDDWIARLGMAQYGWNANEYHIEYERTLTSVAGDRITIDAPIVEPVDTRFSRGEVFKPNITGRIKECGIENLRIESVFTNDTDEDHGWNAITLHHVQNCWVKDVVAKYFGNACVNISGLSTSNSVQDCAMIDPKSVTTGGRKYSFNIQHGSTKNLFQRCVSWGGRHDYVTGSRVPGPNAFVDCVAENTFADIGPHHRWATGLLFDNIYGGEIRVQNRKAMGTGHGWAGAQTLFWNCYSTRKEIKVESPEGGMNWGVGCVGLAKNGNGFWFGWGTPVSPRSLYFKQLEERKGKDAVKAVATSWQIRGGIWERLKAWTAQLVAEPKSIDRAEL